MPARIHPLPLDRSDCEPCSLRIFRDFSTAALRDFESIGMKMRLPKGAVLFQEGDPAGSIAVLYQGQVKLQSTSREGKILIPKIAVAGEVLGLGAVISGSCYEMTAEALGPATIKPFARTSSFRF
jgi:CRP/FNR family transcriptional regulator, cyclic AMP receptor protein